MKNFTRRDFLKTSAVASGGLVLSSSLLNAQSAKSGKKLNVAIVGVGAEGKVLLESLLKIPNLNFVAVCDIWEKYNLSSGILRIAKKNVIDRIGSKKILESDRDAKRILESDKPKAYIDYKDLIANHKDELDAVFIATPDFWHAPQTVDFLEAGINVYCEKMMSDTLEGARSMVRAARKSGKLLQIGHQRKSNPRYIYARDELLHKQQICGSIMACNGQWNRAVTKDIEMANKKYYIPEDILKKYGYTDMNQFLNWRWCKGLGGGAISDLGAHQIDIFGWMLGARPSRVMASGNKDYYKKDWSDNVMCIFEFDKTYQGRKAQAFYQVLTTTSSGGGYFESFMGDLGTLKMSENAALTKLFRENNSTVDWKEKYIDKGIIGEGEAQAAPAKVADARESKALVGYGFPSKVPGFVEEKPIHMYHLENFVGAVRGENKLTCDSEHAYEAEAAVFKARDAITEGPLEFKESDFIVD